MNRIGVPLGIKAICYFNWQRTAWRERPRRKDGSVLPSSVASIVVIHIQKIILMRWQRRWLGPFGNMKVDRAGPRISHGIMCITISCNRRKPLIVCRRKASWFFSMTAQTWGGQPASQNIHYINIVYTHHLSNPSLMDFNTGKK